MLNIKFDNVANRKLFRYSHEQTEIWIITITSSKEF